MAWWYISRTLWKDSEVIKSYFLYFKTKMNAENQMAAATKYARTIREATAAPVNMASCFSQTGKPAKVYISILLMSEQNSSYNQTSCLQSGDSTLLPTLISFSFKLNTYTVCEDVLLHSPHTQTTTFPRFHWYTWDKTQLNIWSPINNGENRNFLVVKVTIVMRKPFSFRHWRMFKILLPLPASLCEHARKLQMWLSTWSATASERVHVYADITSCPGYVPRLNRPVILTMEQYRHFASG